MTSKRANALERNKPNMRITDYNDNLYVHVYDRSKLKKVFPALYVVLTKDYADKIIISSKNYSLPKFMEIIIGDTEPVYFEHDSTLGRYIWEYDIRDIFEEAKAARIENDFLYIAYEL